MKKNCPIGIQSFEEIRKGNYCYIDKTALVYSLTRVVNIIFSAVPGGSERVCLFPRWKPIFKGEKNCLKDFPWESWRRNGLNILFCIWI